ncbi:HPr family phosphocarrier protein [Curtanaerobium respiraculi]|uniref:HPr family phosphocarrier protein n=1 Tax=Curtanaerobium respiraculi TaxID=2949669 RepID=UPI0024B3A597|nr:HPr family phosphocarrier protein [Curtanaerobium respiraculi]
MFSEKVTLINPQGFHMRPASLIVGEAAKFNATVTLVHNGKEIPGNSLMAMMAEGIKCGEELEIRAEGADEEAAVKAIVAFIAGGMGDL